MYTGNSERHGVPSGTAFGLATMRLDGFVSVEAEGFMEGVLVTRPHHWHAKEVRVNVHSLHGGLKVQLQDEMGHAFAGFGDEDCTSICADAINEVVKWRGGRREVAGGKDGGAEVYFLSGRQTVFLYPHSTWNRLSLA